MEDVNEEEFSNRSRSSILDSLIKPVLAGTLGVIEYSVSLLTPSKNLTKISLHKDISSIAAMSVSGFDDGPRVRHIRCRW